MIRALVPYIPFMKFFLFSTTHIMLRDLLAKEGNFFWNFFVKTQSGATSEYIQGTAAWETM
jgi:hypothetical protein